MHKKLQATLSKNTATEERVIALKEDDEDISEEPRRRERTGAEMCVSQGRHRPERRVGL